MDELIAIGQIASGGVGLVLVVLLFAMWRRGDLVPKAVVEMMMAARKEDQAQVDRLMQAVIDALEHRDSPARHSRNS